ncbi:MAG: Gfo/Idh/MocA family oxidoreductase [Ruminococcaceae bacterium]|nr:Gfo/Idh/MocA family oxidoreductase [Oscillospiraceae bacterium]
MHTLAMFGFGGMAGIHHKVLTNDYDKIQVKGVYDIDNKRMDAAKEKGLVAYLSKEDLLNDNEVDIVLVATTNDSHKELCIDALNAGKHVICEKPATMCADDLVEIIECAKKNNKVFTIDQNRRVNKDFVLMRRTVESGIIGKPYVIESRVEGSRGLPSGWREKKAQGGGMMLDWGVHLIDQIMYMIDEKVVNVFCKMLSLNYPEVDDNFRLTLTFESGLIAHIEVSTNNFISHPRWYVLGTDGTLQIDDWSCEGKVVKCLDKENSWGVDIVSTKAGPSKTMAPRSEDTVETIKLSAPCDVMDNLVPTYEQFLDAIDNGAELKIKPEEALRVIKVMEAAFLSSEKCETVKTNI